jgi:rhamnogalacturonyl hydrolase YesR
MVGDLMYTLTINMNGSSRNSEHETLRDARTALIRYQSHEGLWFTIDGWRENMGLAEQTGELRAGTDTVGAWCIS